VDFEEISCKGVVWCGSRYRQVTGTCEHNIEISASTKWGGISLQAGKLSSQKTLFHGVRLCFHANDNYILSPPPAFSTVPFIISVLITVCSRTHAHKLVKLSPIFPLSLQVE